MRLMLVACVGLLCGGAWGGTDDPLFTVDGGLSQDGSRGGNQDGRAPLVRFDVDGLRNWADRARGAAGNVRAEVIRMEGFPLEAGVRVDLEVRPFPVLSERTRFRLGTEAGLVEYPFDPSSVVFLRGSVPGYAGSHVFLALGRELSVGRVELGPGRRTYTISSPGGGLESAEALAVTPTRMSGLAMGGGWCGVDTGAAPSAQVRPDSALDSGLDPVRGMRQIEQRVVGDHELYLMFGDEMETFEYIALVYGAASDIMMRDLKARLDLVDVIVWTEPDPWGGNFPHPPLEPGADIVELFSGTRTTAAGGSARLCGATSQVHGALGYFGDTVNPMIHSHDVRVVAHELGHNVGSLHTHDMGADRCQIATEPPRRGTIMSYCSQSYSGGDGNSDLRFHVLAQAAIAQCMESYRRGQGVTEGFAPDCNQNGVWDEDDIAMGVSNDANANGVPDECEDCNGNNVLDDQDIASGASLDLNANGVPDECEPDCNGNGFPDDMDLVSGTGHVAFEDSFQTDKGWMLENLGATDGDWDRAIPINDPNWTWAPMMDSDGSGYCLVTDNAPGESDVDGGGTRMISPVIDMSAGGYRVSFDYFLGLSMSLSSDSLLVEVNDGSGQWTPIASFSESTAPNWRRHVVDLSTLGGISQTATMRFRFTVSDDAPESIVEAGIDAFRVAGTLSEDRNGNGIPDECEEDCNTNGISDHLEITLDMSLDINRNAVLDECENCDGDEFTDFEEINGAGNVWATVPEEDRIRQYHGITGVLVSESDAVLMEPSDVLITEDARVLVSSTGDDRIVEFDRKGMLVGDLVGPGAGGLDAPGSMAISPRGTLVVASEGSNEVLEYDLSSGAFIGALVSAGSGGLSGPYGLAFRPNGNLFVTSSAGEILEYDAFGAFVRVLADQVPTSIRDIVLLPDGKLVAAAGSQVMPAFDSVTGDPLGQWNNGTFGGRLNLAWGVDVGPSGDLYVSASARGESHLLDPRIHRYNAETGTLIYPFIQGLDSRLNYPRGFDFLPTAGDCNLNLYPDECDIAAGYSQDVNGNGVPDECDTCYADCDQSTGVFVLDIFDFLCFQDAFVGGEAYADCDGSGELDVFDFLCFQDAFAVGCQ